MLVKLAKQNTNKAKDSLRKVRTNAMNKLKKSKDIVSEDTIRLIEKQLKEECYIHDISNDLFQVAVNSGSLLQVLECCWAPCHTPCRAATGGKSISRLRLAE
ncbi:hypothetical protein P7K49_001659 [Saguinus oedipus]|uniref:Ribosome-recycling factor, mitochondrial n=1 Tax=Saguinus oedipus TaxID=9490 RepID=A0ABQ9WF65_SAGOE|nr:hypothetical protein P7K49_001659 [Saguinus oedipus]